jgi:hypothetical protein
LLRRHLLPVARDFPRRSAYTGLAVTASQHHGTRVARVVWPVTREVCPRRAEQRKRLFKPLSVIVKGNMAVISYIDSSKSTNKTTKEVTYSTQRWTDVCLKDGGKWYWISDHGVDISQD